MSTLNTQAEMLAITVPAELELDLDISPIEEATARSPWGSARMNQLEKRTVFAAA
jgi:hypothetical protein